MGCLFIVFEYKSNEKLRFFLHLKIKFIFYWTVCVFCSFLREASNSDIRKIKKINHGQVKI